ncbi:MAG: hypothetical protein U0237_19815 [Thermoleophilia bacterium]
MAEGRRPITHLTTKPLYGWVKQSRVVMVLHALEEDLRRESPGTEAIGLAVQARIEHLMPQAAGQLAVAGAPA